MLLPAWSGSACPVVGMLHCPPLPGSPGFRGDLRAVLDWVQRDAEALQQGGVDGLMLENFGDTPFYPGRVPAITVAAMASIATALRQQFDLPLGINVLRNDGQSALAVAAVCGASFIRTNVLCGARVADQGLLQAIAHDLLRERAYLNAGDIEIWADVDVKHSAALASQSLKDDVHDLIDRGQADAVIVSGSATGQPIHLETLREVKSAAGSAPVILGSGVTAEAISQFRPSADAVIAGSSLKRDGDVRNPVELERVRRLVDAVRAAG